MNRFCFQVTFESPNVVLSGLKVFKPCFYKCNMGTYIMFCFRLHGSKHYLHRFVWHQEEQLFQMQAAEQAEPYLCRTPVQSLNGL